MTDDRRRVVLPDNIPARSPVTIQTIDEDTVLVRRQRERMELLVVLAPDVEHLPEDQGFDGLAVTASRAKLPAYDEL